MTELVIYEQPLSEYINICLRLESLFSRIEAILEQPSQLTIPMAMEYFITILALTERSDLKSRLAQALNSQMTKLQQFERNPDVDGSLLKDYIEVIRHHAERLGKLDGRIGHDLRQNPMLRQMQHQLASIGGITTHMVPLYHLWLQKPLRTQVAELKTWVSELAFLYQINQCLLSSCRDQQAMLPIQAVKGFHQQSFNTSPQIVMIRVGVIKGQNRFPVPSVGKHRVSITFYQQSELVTQIGHERDQDDFIFYLACCH